jgi:hypothetical protein
MSIPALIIFENLGATQAGGTPARSRSVAAGNLNPHLNNQSQALSSKASIALTRRGTPKNAGCLHSSNFYR